MATINYGFTFTPVGTANEEVTATAAITLPSPTGNYTIENDTDGGAHFYAKSQTITIIAVDFYSPDETFTDGVYHLFGTHISGGDSYVGDGYFLKTLALDAAIAAYPQTTPLEVNLKTYLQTERDLVYTNFAGGFYTAASNRILLIQGLLASTTNSTDLTGSMTLTTSSNIQVTVDPTNAYSTDFFCAYGNVLTNTLDGETKDFSSFAYTANNSLAQNGNVTSATMYPSRFADGVYSIGLAAAERFGNPFPPGVLYYGPAEYLLVTTETDLGIDLYQEHYDPTNPTQVANLATLLSLQALVLSEYAANDYAGANQALEDIYAILEQGINWPGLAIELTDKSNFTLEFASLPSGLYTNQTGVLTNTLNGEEYSFTSEEFPEDDTDTVLVLNSETLEAGDEYADGVYQAAVQFNTDGVVFNSIVYGLVLTNIYCGFDKIVAKATTCKYSESLQMKVSVSIKQIINSFERGDYVTANKLIQDTTQMLNSTGCGCGCG